MSETHIPVLFLCKSNSARSIMAEAILNHLGAPHARAFSAGSRPSGQVHPHTLAVLSEAGYEIEGLRSESWETYGASDGPQMALVVTLCDALAEELCPVWPARPARAHWSLPDPVKESAEHDDAREPFRVVRHALELRIRTLLSRLPDTSHLERSALEAAAAP